jgi:hypothetical protein
MIVTRCGFFADRLYFSARARFSPINQHNLFLITLPSPDCRFRKLSVACSILSPALLWVLAVLR